MTSDHPDFPFQLPAILRAAHDIVEELGHVLEVLAEAHPEHDAAITDLAVAIAEARTEWAQANDTTPTTEELT